MASKKAKPVPADASALPSPISGAQSLPSLQSAPHEPLAPPAPIFVGVKLLGPSINWVRETSLLARAAAFGDVAGARQVIAKHNPHLAQWVPSVIHDGLFLAIRCGDAEMVEILAPFADPSDRKAMDRLLAVLVERPESDACAESAIRLLLVPRWKALGAA